MLDNERLIRAQETSRNYPLEFQQIFIAEELLTQQALESVGAKGNPLPSKVEKVDRYFMVPELISNLRIPYAAEILGMPGSGKTIMINRYLEEQWRDKKRHLFAHVEEGSRKLKDEYGDVRYSDPYTYSWVGASISYLGILDSTTHINSGMRVVLTDRGQLDRKVFKRALFLHGKVPPKFMTEEAKKVDELVDTPIQMGGIIMFMTKVETTIKRAGKVGLVVNPEFLPLLSEQYWRLHSEMLQAEVPYRVYTCIDAEKSEEEIYAQFKHAMDAILNLHDTMLWALAKISPEDFDKALADFKRTPKRVSYAERVLGKKLGGKRVKIIGGDDLKDTDDVLKKPFLEWRPLKK